MEREEGEAKRELEQLGRSKETEHQGSLRRHSGKEARWWTDAEVAGPAESPLSAPCTPSLLLRFLSLAVTWAWK